MTSDLSSPSSWVCDGWADCEDKSDEIFIDGAPCDATYHISGSDEFSYCNLFCQPGKKHPKCREDICENPAAFLSSVTRPDILDPHNCQSSCVQDNCT